MSVKHFFCTGLILGSLCGCDSGEAPVFSLKNGQSEADVVAIMGEPTGKMEAGNQTMLLYDGGTIELLDGKTVHLDAEFAESFVKAKKERETWASRAAKLKSKPKPEKPPNPNQQSRPKPREVVLQDKSGNPIDHSSLVVRGSITIVDFYATWCGPCRKMDPVLRRMADGDPEVVLRKVDIGDWGSRVTKQYNISSVPNVRVFDRSGRLVAPPSSSPDTIQKNIERAKKQ